MNTILSTLSITRESLVLIVVFILLFLNEPKITITIFFFLIIIAGTFLSLTRKKLIITGELYESENASQLRTINHALGSIRETKVLNRENYLINSCLGVK